MQRAPAFLHGWRHFFTRGVRGRHGRQGSTTRPPPQTRNHGPPRLRQGRPGSPTPQASVAAAPNQKPRAAKAAPRQGRATPQTRTPHPRPLYPSSIFISHWRATAALVRVCSSSGLDDHRQPLPLRRGRCPAVVGGAEHPAAHDRRPGQGSGRACWRGSAARHGAGGRRQRGSNGRPVSVVVDATGGDLHERQQHIRLAVIGMKQQPTHAPAYARQYPHESKHARTPVGG